MTDLATLPQAASAPFRHADGTVRLLVSCPDRPGIVAAISRFLFDAGANIVRSDQYSTDPSGGTFSLRMVFTLEPDGRDAFAEDFGLTIADRFHMTWRLWDAARRKRVAILVSRHDHCLVDLLWRWQRNELEADIVQVASNHPDLRELVETSGLPYGHVAVEQGRKAEAEAKLLELLDGTCDLVVLARYMQILSGVIRVTHRDDVDDLVRLGAEVERAVLGRAVQWHCQDRVVCHGNTTVVF